MQKSIHQFQKLQRGVRILPLFFSRRRGRWWCSWEIDGWERLQRGKWGQERDPLYAVCHILSQRPIIIISHAKLIYGSIIHDFWVNAKIYIFNYNIIKFSRETTIKIKRWYNANIHNLKSISCVVI